MNQERLKKYATLIVKAGVNLQQGQTLVITAPIETAAFARMVAEQAYDAGAREVVMDWNDELSKKIKYLKAPEAVFDEYPEWKRMFYQTYAREGAAFVSIAAEDPELMKNVEPQRIMRAQKASNTANTEFRERLMGNANTWNVVSVPTVSWARKVFPEKPEAAAMEALWEAILTSVRVDEPDPVEAWKHHKQHLEAMSHWLNEKQFHQLHFSNSLGTDLTITLPEGHIWTGGAEVSQQGIDFIANMPTEEVFTLPHRQGVDGLVVSSMPLQYNGNLIENFSITFQQGKVVDFKADKGYETLKGLIETDEGSHYLGEVALVPHHSPISNTGILFYNTLFDENASCHLAIGKAYPVCLKGGTEMSKEEQREAGINDSLVHEDFMIGTADLEIMGITAEGERIPVFRQGNYAASL
ncbi:aminopeptidase [Anoxynatronum buryatiense]|uniref:Aminopeptidase II. Metallo peptidase. MEROPS family M29 n=1 Tax=Anoxynatronum buryatiense TaxID=489973 RepID=A0AA46AHV6_9CLOT|nr:aminopeptidase [Anoxynatronum buryatiense]SMP43968.1 aminopeptidase II. Metallo peptidase. MEROPS family M29 [Anoxynatronum buryatiense]